MKTYPLGSGLLTWSTEFSFVRENDVMFGYVPWENKERGCRSQRTEMVVADACLYTRYRCASMTVSVHNES